MPTHSPNSKPSPNLNPLSHNEDQEQERLEADITYTLIKETHKRIMDHKLASYNPTPSLFYEPGCGSSESGGWLGLQGPVSTPPLKIGLFGFEGSGRYTFLQTLYRSLRVEAQFKTEPRFTPSSIGVQYTASHMSLPFSQYSFCHFPGWNLLVTDEEAGLIAQNTYNLIKQCEINCSLFFVPVDSEHLNERRKRALQIMRRVSRLLRKDDVPFIVVVSKIDMKVEGAQDDILEKWEQSIAKAFHIDTHKFLEKNLTLPEENTSGLRPPYHYSAWRYCTHPINSLPIPIPGSTKQAQNDYVGRVYTPTTHYLSQQMVLDHLLLFEAAIYTGERWGLHYGWREFFLRDNWPRFLIGFLFLLIVAIVALTHKGSVKKYRW